MTAEPGDRNILETAEKHYLSGRLDQAEAALRHIIKKSGAPPQTLSLLSKILIESGKPQQAAFELERAVKVRPGDVDLTMMLHNAYLASGRADDALTTVERVATEHPDSEDVLSALAALHLNAGRIGEAGSWYRKALAANPESIKAMIGLSRALSASLRGAEAVEVFRDALKRDIRSAGVYRVLAFQMQYASGIDLAEMFEYQKTAGQLTSREADGYPPRLEVDPDPDRKLTIGYLSGDFFQHACAHFIEPLLAARDRASFRVIAYSSTVVKDDTTRRLRAQCDAWRDVAVFKGAALSNFLAQDKVDIAIDLSGHTSGTRLSSLVLRPAPITANYMGFASSTGMPGVDYRLVDSATDPQGAEAFATERLVRLDPCFLCFRPLADAPAVSPAPSATGAPVTFGSFNVIDKISDATLDVWAGVLKATPGSRLLLKTKPLADEFVRDRVRAEFAIRGIGPDRLELIGWTKSLRDHLDLYSRIDIALDTFPYNGTTTTCEAMWMGVSVVTLRGHVHAARVGASLLGAIGLNDLIASDVGGYVAAAAALASDRNRIASLRASLRDRMSKSPLRDERGFMQRFEGTLRSLWREWCAKKK